MSEPRVRTADEGDLAAGQQVGDYVVEATIGKGGFGTVYRATHPLIGKVAAIKVLKRVYSAEPDMVSRFVAEARAVNQIRHRHIIDIFGFGVLDDGRHYYIMEYLEGEPLDEHIDRVGRLTLEQALPILRGVAKALDAAHAKGIAHRDLKPENVFLVQDPGASTTGDVFAKLLDFGIAKLLSTAEAPSTHKTGTGIPLGTPHYMSPEQCRGREVDHRTDIYAFGIVTFRMLTGQLPFDGEDYMTILMKQLSSPPPSACELFPELPPHVDRVIGWMLAKTPGERPQSLIEAVRALGEGTAFDTPGFTSSPAITTPPPHVDANASPTVTGTVAPRRRGMLVAVATLPLIAAAITFALIQRGDDATPAVAPLVDPAPAIPSNVAVTVRGLPAGTRILVDGTPIAEVRGVATELWLPRSAATKTLRFERDGYEPTERAVATDQPSTLELSLVAIAPPPPPATVAKPKPKPKSKPKSKPKAKASDPSGPTGPTGSDAIEPPKGLFDKRKTP